MPLILSIETSTPVCSVALHAEGKLVASFDLYTEKSHASALTRLIEQSFAYCEFSLSQVDTIAVAKGPGSFTGLRIGSATAKGLCYALDKPLIAVSTLEAMAWGMSQQYIPEAVLLCPMLDARRMEVYRAVYTQTLEEIVSIDAQILDDQSFNNLLVQQQVLFFGNGAAKCQAVLSHSRNAIFQPAFHPSAKFIGDLARKKYQAHAFEDVAYFEPFYLKEFFFRGKGSQ